MAPVPATLQAAALLPRPTAAARQVPRRCRCHDLHRSLPCSCITPVTMRCHPRALLPTGVSRHHRSSSTTGAHSSVTPPSPPRHGAATKHPATGSVAPLLPFSLCCFTGSSAPSSPPRASTLRRPRRPPCPTLAAAAARPWHGGGLHRVPLGRRASGDPRCLPRRQSG